MSFLKIISQSSCDRLRNKKIDTLLKMLQVQMKEQSMTVNYLF